MQCCVSYTEISIENDKLYWPSTLKHKWLYVLLALPSIILFDSQWLLECGAVKQWETTSCMLCAHCLPANRTFQKQKSGRGARVRSFDLAEEARQMAKFAQCPFAKTTAKLL